MRRRKRKGFRKYKFTEKTFSKRGIVSLVLALGSIASCVIMLAESFHSAGNLSIYIACFGILAWVGAILALIIGGRSLREQNTFRTFPYLGVGCSVLAVLMWSGLYLAGILTGMG